MISVSTDVENKIATLTPQGSLQPQDFQNAAAEIDPLIEEHGMLNGLIVYVEDFPGWESFAAFSSHIRFVRNHHQQIKRVALVTDSSIGDFAEDFAGHFVAAKIRHFPYTELSQAKNWILESGEC